MNDNTHEIVNLLREAINRIESLNDNYFNGACWRVIDAAGLLAEMCRDRPTVLAAQGHPTGRGYKIVNVYEEETSR